MTKLIDLSQRKQATDLLVDCATIAVWYGFPEASRLLLEWMKHRSDNAAQVLWIDALRSMRFEHYEEAKSTLRSLLERDSQDAHAQALLIHVLLESGERAIGASVVDRTNEEAMEPTAQALLKHTRARHAEASSYRHTPAYGSYIG
jgi:thioredoxin-like negative regulator of GroEL